MSSSDDDSEFFDPSPVVETTTRRGNRRKAHTPSPKKVPRKKQREVLADFNVEYDESEEEADENYAGRRNPRGVYQGKRKRVEVSSTESNVEDEEDRRGSTSSEMENRPPPATAATVSEMADAIPEENSQQPNNNAEGPARTRKRLSIRSENSGEGRRSSVSGSGVESVVATASEVQTIYDTCSQMFNANRINPQNAFNMRLLDCINQMINSPGYDKSNMQLTSSTVEIGTKIYVCRVDNTHSQVLSLASDITLQQRKRKNDRGDGENQGENEAGMEDGEDGLDEESNNGRQKQKRKMIRKRGRFVEEDNNKLLTELEEQNAKYVTRRNFLKKKFNAMIFEDLGFDYLGCFTVDPLDTGEPVRIESETEKIKVKINFPEHIRRVSNEIHNIEFMPFQFLPTYDPETHSIWGGSLNEAEELRHQYSHRDPQLPVNEEFAYDPANRPAEYPDEGAPDMNDTLGEALPHFGDGEDDAGNGDIPAVSFHDIRSLDHLDEYFQKVRNLLKVSKSKYGWCGPNFVRPKATWPAQRPGGRKPRAKKEPERIDFTKIDWTDRTNKFNPNQPAKTIYDDKVIESWNTRSTVIPFLGIEITSYDDDFDPLDFQNENDPKYVPTIFKLFTSRNRSILDLISNTADKKRYSSGAPVPHHDVGDDEGFDNDNDIELPRDIAEDFCSQPANEDGYHPADGATPGDAWQFPASVPGLLNDDPLSLVSGIDSIRFSKKPKPIDMSQLKRAIIKTLITSLKLDTETVQPLEDGETKINLAQLMLQVLKRLDTRTEKLLSVPIFIVALMHVVADKRLFVLYDDADPNCPVILCRGKNFKHADHIPMPVDGLDYD